MFLDSGSVASAINSKEHGCKSMFLQCKNLFPQCKTPLSQFTEIYSEFRFNFASEVPAKTPKRCLFLYSILYSVEIWFHG